MPQNANKVSNSEAKNKLPGLTEKWIDEAESDESECEREVGVDERQNEENENQNEKENNESCDSSETRCSSESFSDSLLWESDTIEDNGVVSKFHYPVQLSNLRRNPPITQGVGSCNEVRKDCHGMVIEDQDFNLGPPSLEVFNTAPKSRSMQQSTSLSSQRFNTDPTVKDTQQSTSSSSQRFNTAPTVKDTQQSISLSYINVEKMKR